MLLKVVLFAYSRASSCRRNIERACRDQVTFIKRVFYSFNGGLTRLDYFEVHYFGLPVFLNRILIRLACANPNDMLDWSDEYFAIANFPSMGSFHNRIDSLVQHCAGDHDF